MTASGSTCIATVSLQERFPLDVVRIWSFSSRSSRRTDKEWRRGSLRSRRTRHRPRAEEARAAPRRNATLEQLGHVTGGGRLLFGGNARDDCGVARREIREPAPARSSEGSQVYPVLPNSDR